MVQGREIAQPLAKPQLHAQDRLPSRKGQGEGIGGDDAWKFIAETEARLTAKA